MMTATAVIRMLMLAQELTTMMTPMTTTIMTMMMMLAVLADRDKMMVKVMLAMVKQHVQW